MKTSAFALFFSVAISVYGLINAYVFIRGLSAFGSPAGRAVFSVLFWACALTFFAGRFLERAGSGAVVQALIWIGSLWFSVVLYGFLIAQLTDLFRLVNAFAHFLPALTDALRLRLFLAFLAGILLLHAFGYAGACRLKVRTLDIALPAGQSGLKALTVAVASDIHLGTIVGKKRLSRIVDLIQSLKPDLILFPGDIIDEDPQPAIRKNLGEVLKGLSAPLGVFACTGNHEYIGGIKATSRYLKDHGITLLRDTAVVLNGGLAVASREDASKERFTGEKRKPLKEILAALKPGHPVIVMDHEPSALSEAAESGADLLLCGHTHAGQFFPINLIVKAIYELAYGYKVKGRTHVIVSSGAGTWGPPIRILAAPEIVVLRIRFE
jgi:hypothetical protein